MHFIHLAHASENRVTMQKALHARHRNVCARIKMHFSRCKKKKKLDEFFKYEMFTLVKLVQPGGIQWLPRKKL
jgi:hypothetical protein